MRKLGAEPYATNPEQFLDVLKRNVVRWGEIVRATGAKPE
jgi:tripartite-type tricarboxylate transporter receptor subunit TctC